MKKFQEWLEDTHPECLANEGMVGDYMKKFALPVTAAMGVAGAFGGGDGDGHTAPPNNRPTAVANASQDQNEFISYAAQRVERQLGGSQRTSWPKPAGWDELSDEERSQIYSRAHDSLVRQYGARNKEELKMMFDKHSAEGRYE